MLFVVASDADCVAGIVKNSQEIHFVMRSGSVKMQQSYCWPNYPGRKNGPQTY